MRYAKQQFWYIYQHTKQIRFVSSDTTLNSHWNQSDGLTCQGLSTLTDATVEVEISSNNTMAWCGRPRIRVGYSRLSLSRSHTDRQECH